MSKYTHGTNHYRYQRANHHRKALATTLCLILIISGTIGLSTYLDQSSLASVTSSTVRRAYTPQKRSFKTTHFQFDAPSSWASIHEESSEGRYIYRNRTDLILQQELTIYVNSTPSQVGANRVMPVTLQTNKITPQKISEHCRSLFPQGDLVDKNVSLSGVNFFCSPSSTSYVVSVGVVSGGTSLELTNAHGVKNRYAIVYRDLTAVPTASSLSEILQSFRSL